MNLENMWKIMRGNNLEYIDDINSDYVCTICKNILIESHSNARCGCRYCNRCIQAYLTEERKLCPGKSELCDKNEVIDIDRDIHIDQPINIKISKLRVMCPNNGCQSIVELKSMEDHLKICDKGVLRCLYHDLGCKINRLTNEEVVDHLSTEIHSHTRLLIEWIIEYQNNSESLKKDVDQLRNDNNDLKEKMILIEERSQIQTMDTEILKSENNDLKEKIIRTENIIRDLQKGKIQNSEEIEKIEEEISSLKNDNRYLKGELKTIQNQITQHFSSSKPSPQIENPCGGFEKMNNKLTTFISQNKLLKEELKNIETYHSKLATQIEQQRKEIVQLKQCKVDKTQFDDKLKIQHENMSDIEMKLNDLTKPFKLIQTQSDKTIQSIIKIKGIVDKINYPEFIWKLDKWSEKRKQSKKGPISDIYSDSFFSFWNGYKMCLRVFPDGNGTGKSTHLSIFFSIMKGPFDDILQWPFMHDVQISLINQQSGLDHATWTAKCCANPHNDSFNKPTNLINIGCGNPEFIKLEEISTNLELSRNNQIFIKCLVKLN